jgi:uncharacterized protein YaaN involved in tellurite resistance
MSMIIDPSQENFTLAVPEPVAEVTPDKVQGENSILPAVSTDRQVVLATQAKEITTDMVSVNVNDPHFDESLKAISGLGGADIIKATNAPNRLLDQGTSLASAKKNGKGDATLSVVSSLSELRGTVSDLTPNAADLNKAQKFLGIFPMGKKIQRYFERYESANDQIDKIIKSLMTGQDELRKDNAALQGEKIALYETMKQLNEWAFLAQKLDDEVTSQVAVARNRGDVEAATKLESDVLFAIRQRRTDILTQLAVSAQGYLAMGLVQKNNEELIKGVERARTTTLSALRTAIILAKALTNQELVIKQIAAVNETTNNAILQSSEMLKRQTGLIHEQAASSGVSVETLTQAFDNIFATIDEVESFKLRANESMDKTITSLNTQLERARPAINRAKELEAS